MVALGEDYNIDFLAAGAVYEAANQVNNGTNDGLLIDVLRASNSTVLHSFSHVPAAPVGPGDLGLLAVSFSYTGDGSGDILFRVGPDNANQGRFQGTIDDLTLSQVNAVPEPASIALWCLTGIGLGVFGYLRVRKQRCS